jgi:RNA polymerase sigma-70 factor (ECF subfamily)
MSSAGPAHFATTHWSLVRQARGSSPQAQAALEVLCGRYWYPIYAFLRRRGSSPENASDLTQDFFATLLEKEYLDDADRQRGRFRTFLLIAVSRFASKAYEHDQAQKRGGGRKRLSLDMAEGESRYQYEPADDWTPEKIFARRWALTILDAALSRLRSDYEKAAAPPCLKPSRFT